MKWRAAMRVLNLLTSGDIGGIESLCRDIGKYSNYESACCFLFDGGPIYDQIKKKQETYCLKDNKGKLSIKKLKKLMNIAQKYDIIVVHHGDPLLKLYYYALARLLNKKFITVVHSCYEDMYFYPNQPIKKFLGRQIFQKSMSISDRIIFVSEAGKQSYEKSFRIPKEKSCIVYNGVGMDKIEAGRNVISEAPETYQLTYIGRLEQVKGVNLLLDAVWQLREKYSLRLAIVGDGKNREELEKQAERLGLGSEVTFYGKQADVVPFLKQTDIFVYPSICQEVFGISIIEAMAFGKLCVANRVGGIPEIIQDGINGFLTDETSAQGIVRAIERAIQSYQNGRYRDMAAAAKETAERFSIAHTIENLENVFCEVLQ